MTTKAEHREVALEYLSNPDNEIPTRVVLATEVLGMATSQQLYNMFSVEDLEGIEAEALKVRRTKYAPELSKVDNAMLREAGKGDARAAKLCYQRFEGWSEKKDIGIVPGKDADGNAMKWTVEIVRPEDKK
jgi:hypothetical protein